MIHKRREQKLTMPQTNTPNTHLQALVPSLLEVKCEPYYGPQVDTERWGPNGTLAF